MTNLPSASRAKKTRGLNVDHSTLTIGTYSAAFQYVMGRSLVPENNLTAPSLVPTYKSIKKKEHFKLERT